MAEYDDTIRVLIADDVSETREILEKSLYFEKDITVVGKAATEAIMAQVPSTQVIIMSVQNEQEYLRRAMLAGAREYLIKPPDSDELVRAIRHVAKLQPL